MALTLVKGNIIEDGAVTSAKLTATSITSATILDNTITNVKMAVDPSNASNLNAGTVAAARMPPGYVEPLDPIMNDVAVVGFKIAANGSLAKYNLVDQSVDAFETSAGIDAPASSDQVYNSGSKYFAATVVAGATDTFTTVASTSWSAPAGLTSVTYLVIAGGGGGGAAQGYDYGGGGGGAGGLRTGSHPVTGGNNYTVVVGGGGPGSTTPSGTGTVGGVSQFDTINASGGGPGAGGTAPGTPGGSGGGSSGGGSNPGAIGPGNVGGYTPPEGYNGAANWPTRPYQGGGGGGSGTRGYSGGERSPTNYGAGNGGSGRDLSATFGTGVGVSGVFAGGGGGGYNSHPNVPSPKSQGSGGTGGGGPGSNAGPGTQTATPGTVNTGSGGGGGSTGNTAGYGGNGGSGIVIVKYDSVYAAAMTLVSTATTAQTAPTKGDLVMLWSDGTGTASINTDITAEYSADNGSTYTSMTLVAQGTTGGQNLVAASDVTLTSTSGTTMRYRVKALNQSVSRSTRIHAVSLGWS